MSRPHQKLDKRPAVLALCLAVSAPALSSQHDPEPKELAAAEVSLNTRAVQVLLRFARTAHGKKFGPKEKEAYELILRYDTDHARARRTLDFEREKSGGWRLVPPKKRRGFKDDANRKGRFTVQQEWRKTCLKLAAEHRELGLKMQAADAAYEKRAVDHLRRAIHFNPLDKGAHVALGHDPCKVGETTYYGTTTQVAFIRRMAAIETFALTLAKKNYNPQPIKDIPKVLAKTGLEFAGAKTEHFTVFVRGTQANADDVVQWGERALEFLDFCVGDEQERTKRRARRYLSQWGWIGFIWTDPEFEKFKKLNPGLVEKTKGKYSNLTFPSGDKTCEVTRINMPSHMHDSLIAHVFHYGLGSGEKSNTGLLEGVHHAATWFLKSTCISKFGGEPKGTVSSARIQLPDGANWWLREMRNQAIAFKDVPLNVIPRTELYKFSPDIRLKTWSFGVWAMARFPNAWLQFLRQCPTQPLPHPDTIDKIGVETFGMPLTQVEAEWREWAAGRGVTATATGYGPPLLPEFPNRDELEGLERLNAVRREVTCFSEGIPKPKPGAGRGTVSPLPNSTPGQWNRNLPECELDSEATAACKDHARFFGKHEEHWKWPEAHEEDPAKEGFTPRGMRAGLRSVIVWTDGEMDATRAIDSWIGTVYHRFPLLEYNIKRFGLAHDAAGKCEVIVLDMGSLQEPRSDLLDRACAFIAWPPQDMKNIPRQFAFTEHPNPLADVGLDFDGQKGTGYPVSLQFSKLFAQTVSNVTMRLYEGNKSNGQAGAEVPCWLHTPDEPLLKRMVMRNVVFVIPKAVLKSKQTYTAIVELNAGSPRTFEWSFTTGTKMQGLGKLKKRRR